MQNYSISALSCTSDALEISQIGLESDLRLKWKLQWLRNTIFIAIGQLLLAAENHLIALINELPCLAFP